MCQFISLYHLPATGEVKVCDLNSHGETEKELKLNLKIWREGHYIPNGEIVLRFTEDDRVDKVEYKTAFKNRFPTFVDFFNWSMEQEKVKCSYLDLSSLTTLDPKVKLPEKIGSSLYLRSLTTLDPKVKLPEKIGGSLDLRSLTTKEKEELREKYPKISIY